MKKVNKIICILLALLIGIIGMVSCKTSDPPAETTSPESDFSIEEITTGGETTAGDGETTEDPFIPPEYSDNQFMRMWQDWIKGLGGLDALLRTQGYLENPDTGELTVTKYTQYLISTADGYEMKYVADIYPYGRYEATGNTVNISNSPIMAPSEFDVLIENKVFIQPRFKKMLDEASFSSNVYIPVVVLLPSSFAFDNGLRDSLSTFKIEFKKVAPYLDRSAIPYLPLEFYEEHFWNNGLNVNYMVTFMTVQQIQNFSPDFDGYVSLDLGNRAVSKYWLYEKISNYVAFWLWGYWSVGIDPESV